MERNRKTRIVAVTSMLIAVVFLTIAYAVFSKNLNIQNMSATVKANAANFSVKFSKSSTTVDEGDIIPEGTAQEMALNAHIDNSGPNPKLTDISLQISDATFDTRYVSYGVYALNTGKIDAYLKSIKIDNVPGYDKPLVCIPKEETAQKLVDEACKNIEMHIYISNVGQDMLKVTSEGGFHGGNSPGATFQINEKLSKGKYHSIKIDFNWQTNITLIDGSFEIKIGDVNFEYNSQ